MLKRLVDALTDLANALRCVAKSNEEGGHRMSCHLLELQRDIHNMEIRIMAKLEELVEAATALSTASDGFSVKVDDLIVKVDKVLDTLGDAEDLPPDAVDAIAALKASKEKTAASGARVDAQVLKLDGVLDTPAPAGPPA